MVGTIENRLREIGMTLPQAAKPVANYVPFRIAGRHIHISGQLPVLEGKPKIIGKVGENVSIEDAQLAAKICTLNLVSQLKAACQQALDTKVAALDGLLKVIKLEGFINATADFTEHATVMNGASDLMVEIFGQKGHHARIAVGVSSLPLGVPVEISGVFEIDF